MRMGRFDRCFSPCIGLWAAGCLVLGIIPGHAAPLTEAPVAAVGPSLAARTKTTPNTEAPSTRNDNSTVTTRMERVGNAEVLRVLVKGATYPVSGKILRYSERLLKKYDVNEDGVLQREEWEKIAGQPQQIDVDHDGLLTLQDLSRYIARYGRAHRLHLVPTLPQAAGSETAAELPLFQPTAAKGALHSAPESILPDEVAEMGEGESEEEEEEVSPDGMPLEPSKTYPSGVQGKSWKKLRSTRKFYVAPHTQAVAAPEWFRLRDLDGDGQLTLAEYAPHATQTELLEFARYDLDHDGLLTLKEVARFASLGSSRSAAAGTVSAATSATAAAASTTTGAAAADYNRASVYSKSAKNYGNPATTAGTPTAGATRSATTGSARTYPTTPRSKTNSTTVYGGTR